MRRYSLLIGIGAIALLACLITITEESTAMTGTGTVGDPFVIYDVDDLQNMSLNLNANYTLANDIDASATALWNPVIPSGDPVGRWNMDEPFWNGTAGEVVDSSGNDLNATALGNATTVTDGVYGRAGYFNGTTGFVEGGNDPSLQITGGLTISAWVNLTSYPASEGTIAEWGASGESLATNYLYQLRVRADGRLRVIHEYNNGVNIIVETTFPQINTTGIWYHVSVTRDTMAKEYKFYVNGTIVDTISYSNDPADGSSGSFRIGATVSGTNKLNGNLDDVRIYNFALNETNINHVKDGNDCNPQILHNYGFEPIGSVASRFNGSLDGQGFTISNLTINRPTDDNVGLFSYLNDTSTVTDLDLINATIAGHNYVGGFTGSNSGTITNCYSTSTTTGDDYVGGFTGWNDGTITNSYSTSTTTGGLYVGGFTGYNLGGGTITNSYSTGTTTGDWYVGGFTGRNDGTITNSYSTGTTTGTGNYVGGFTGYNFGGTITNSYSTSTTIGDYHVGGFTGTNVGGTITNSYSTSTTTGNDYVGGFTGRNTGTITNSYSTGSATGVTDVGGFTGYNWGTVSNCFWDTESSGNPISDGGTGKTTAEMKLQATFTGWNFTTPWGIVETVTYPFLTPINPIITTQQVTIMDRIDEDTMYMIYFESAAQPVPWYNAIVSWDIETNATGWLSITSTGVLSGTPANADVGIYYVKVKAMDSVGREGSYNFTLTVRNVEPTITTSDVNVTNTGALYEIGYDSTDDPSTTWNLTTNAQWLSINQLTGVISGIPTKAQAGSYWVNVTVMDGNGGMDISNFSLEVRLDTDRDGIPDDLDSDDDNDGWIDIVELVIGSDPLVNSSMPLDLDGDMISDILDNDMDGDGYNNTDDEFPTDNSEWNDTDGDGIGDNSDLDVDGDGANNTVDAFPTNLLEDTDTDNDGTGDNADTDDDGDGWTDIVELVVGSDPLVNTSMPTDLDNNMIADLLDPEYEWNYTERERISDLFNQTWASISSLEGNVSTAFADQNTTFMAELAKVNTSLYDDIQTTMADLTADIALVNSSLADELTALEASMLTDSSAMRTWVDLLLAYVNDNVTGLDADLLAFENSTGENLTDVNTELAQLSDILDRLDELESQLETAETDINSQIVASEQKQEDTSSNNNTALLVLAVLVIVSLLLHIKNLMGKKPEDPETGEPTEDEETSE